MCNTALKQQGPYLKIGQARIQAVILQSGSGNNFERQNYTANELTKAFRLRELVSGRKGKYTSGAYIKGSSG